MPSEKRPFEPMYEANPEMDLINACRNWHRVLEFDLIWATALVHRINPLNDIDTNSPAP
jgi:hypothetical protein